jgi:hypothetical protein
MIPYVATETARSAGAEKTAPRLVSLDAFRGATIVALRVIVVPLDRSVGAV